MVEVEEIELDLGLSIGGRRTLKKKRECSRVCQEQWESKRERKTENGLWTTVPFHVQLVPFNNNGFASKLPMWVPPPVLANGETENRKEKSNNGSSMCSSSVVSDYQTSSHEDGGSTESHSHSAHSLTEPTQLNNSKENYITSQPEQSSSSLPMRSQLGSNSEWINQNVKENQQNTAHGPSKETKVDMGKPPKPVTQTFSSLPQMPYVSTTGNGPNGKTVKGFLYKYSKSEVSIVCVCHGSTFSPAEFVQHAGGTDISHPLRHITVIPYAFG